MNKGQYTRFINAYFKALDLYLKDMTKIQRVAFKRDIAMHLATKWEIE